MGRKNKIPPELKIQAVLEYLNGCGSCRSIASKYGVTYTPFRKWIAKYKSQGEVAFAESSKNNLYSSSFKETVVQAYLKGEGSLQDTAIKYKIPTQDTVREWVMKYNSHEKLKASRIGGTIMTKGRSTTFDEKVEIVKYCIEHKNNYAEAAQKYQVSYQQVYTWTIKYEKDGAEALSDRRGKRKSEDKMSELEKLRAQNKLLEAENKRQNMEIDFLKKLDEIGRRRY
jgi:transposase